MDTLTLAYGLVWMSVALYAGWLGVQQRRLTRRLVLLETEQQSGRGPMSARTQSSRAA